MLFYSWFKRSHLNIHEILLLRKMDGNGIAVEISNLVNWACLIGARNTSEHAVFYSLIK